jgi:NADPH:quinone reductase
MRAIVVDHTATGNFSLQCVDEPTCASNEALVQVGAFSLNQAEVAYAGLTPVGTRSGMDLAGVVVQPAPDGSGPAGGTRVVGLLPTAAWAELAAVPTNALCVLPDAISFTQAATVPVAGLTALHAIERGTGLLGRTILVTGASGGLGLFACQIAHLSGARVVGLIRRESNRAVVREARADAIVVGEGAADASQYGPYRLIVESVGGRVLADVLGMLGPDGVCVSVGASSGSDAVPVNPLAFLMAGRVSLYGLLLWNELARESAATGLERLVRMLALGRLRPHIAVEAAWVETGPVAQQLLDRRWPGKAVLRIE